MVTVDGLQLYTADESSPETQAQLDVTSPPGSDPGEALLVGLKSQETVTVSGLATGIRLSGQSGYPSAPTDALAEWLAAFESLCSAEQGGGWDIVDNERDRTIRAIVTDVSWTYAEGAPFQARWTLTAERGDGAFSDASRSPRTPTPQSTTTLAGTDLGGVVEKRTELSIDVGTIPIAFADESETIVVPNSGILRRVTISGRMEGSYSNLRTRDSDLRNTVGQDTIQTYQSGIPGDAYDVRPGNYSSTVNAGSPTVWDYSLELLEGLSL